MSAKKYPIKRITIEGFKSIKSLETFELNSLNVLIGANGAGKSNFVSYFRFLREMVECRLQSWVVKQGGADRILSYGVKETSVISSSVNFGLNGYKFALQATVDSGFVIEKEAIFFDGPYYGPKWTKYGSGHKEAKLREKYLSSKKSDSERYVYESILSWQVYHFHDTSETAGVKRHCSLHDNETLRNDASNLAAYLYKLQNNHQDTYEQIRKTVALAIPFFDNFVLKPFELPTGEEQIRLLWRQKDSDYALWPSQLSDGSIRFICLTTALMQPDPPSTIIIDEPELGLHPYAITLLGSLLNSAKTRMQIIVSTQSVPLLNQFSINDLIVVERENGETVLKRLDEDDFLEWLEEYSIGELWEKNILGGRPD